MMTNFLTYLYFFNEELSRSRRSACSSILCISKSRFRLVYFSCKFLTTAQFARHHYKRLLNNLLEIEQNSAIGPTSMLRKNLRNITNSNLSHISKVTNHVLKVRYH